MTEDFFMVALSFTAGMILAACLLVSTNIEVINERIQDGYFAHEGKVYRVQEVTP